MAHILPARQLVIRVGAQQLSPPQNRAGERDPEHFPQFLDIGAGRALIAAMQRSRRLTRHLAGKNRRGDTCSSDRVGQACRIAGKEHRAPMRLSDRMQHAANRNRASGQGENL